MRLFREPLFHFVLIGVLLFIYKQYQQTVKTYEIVSLDKDARQQLSDDFIKQSGRAPSQAELGLLAEQELDSRILFTEALRRNFHRDDSVVIQRLLRDANFLGFTGSDQDKIRAALVLGIHESDEVIRSRMIQRMESVGRSHANRSPTDAELMALYRADLARWQTPDRFNFTQIFFSADRDEDPAQRAKAALRAIQLKASAEGLGDPSLHGSLFVEVSTRDIAKVFGESFGEAVAAKSTLLNEWQGPISSVYGQHLVRVTRATSGQRRKFEEVRTKLALDWQEQSEREALAAFIANLRERYLVLNGEETK